jgi:glycosyltransferase involved in cell wall biosynthesis
MRVYIWNAHWNTLGGGEVYAGKIAEILNANGFEVILLGFGKLNRLEMKNRLGINIDSIEYIKLEREIDINMLVGRDDIFVNGSFGSTFHSPTEKSIYIVHFPTRKFPRYLQFFLSRIPTLEVSSANGQSVFLTGFFDLLVGSGSIRIPEDNKVRITCLYGEARALITSGKTLHFSLDTPVELEGEELVQVKQLGDLNSVLRIESDRTPSMIYQSLRNRMSQSSAFIDSYSQIWANSNFTNKYIELFWDRQSSVVYPPVKSFDGNDSSKNPYQITSVGRFMSPEEGHSKNQHLLIDAFQILCESSDKPWVLNLIGGVSSKDKYFQKIQRLVAKSRLNIKLYPNCSEQLLQEIMKTSQFYWHATGMNVKTSEPQKMEHFGISVVEAINSGAIPIVFDSAGPAEILSSFPKLRFHTVDDLAQITEDLASLGQSGMHDIQQDLKVVGENFSISVFQKSLLANIKTLSMN